MVFFAATPRRYFQFTFLKYSLILIHDTAVLTSSRLFKKLKINKTLGVTAYSYKFPLILLITTILSVHPGNNCLKNPKMDKRYTKWCLQSHWYDYEHLVVRIHLGYTWWTQNVVRDLAYKYLLIFNTTSSIINTQPALWTRWRSLKISL